MTTRKIAAILAASTALLGLAQPASAQFYPGFRPPPPPICMTPVGPAPCGMPIPMPPPPVYMGAPAPMPVPGIPGGINPRGRDAWGVMGPALGAGAAGVLQGYGVPAPVAGWAGERINSNAQAAYRERGVANQGIRTGTGISVRDIEEHGIFGGPNSVFNCPFGGC
jgi:hypothetical protein